MMCRLFQPRSVPSYRRLPMLRGLLTVVSFTYLCSWSLIDRSPRNRWHRSIRGAASSTLPRSTFLHASGLTLR
ncbi:hypothetical protein BDR03DRAFT_939966 [Suillus americanus]|nr:hypothetical protein BDR03DRAFT_939966 [Suillus americanus]